MKSISFRILIGQVLLLFIYSGPSLQSQTFDKDVSLGTETKRLVQIEEDLGQRLKSLIDNLQKLAEITKKGNYVEARRLLLEMKKNLDQAERDVSGQRSLTSLKKFMSQLESDLRNANRALMKANKEEALNSLAQAYRRAQALEDADSPVLKITAAEIALNNASDLIAGKDYQNAALYLEQAIDYITEIQTSGPIKTLELNQIKSDIIITHKQVILGKLQDQKALSRFVPGFEAARYNAINSYYDIWSRSDEPWRVNY
ncbi:MAG: hypothetical protein H7A32_04000 [Deltaproteobacteria bacterium]|nr:hypothetical protein [Deltaproteobacteria bacterium]